MKGIRMQLSHYTVFRLDESWLERATFLQSVPYANSIFQWYHCKTLLGFCVGYVFMMCI